MLDLRSAGCRRFRRTARFNDALDKGDSFRASTNNAEQIASIAQASNANTIALGQKLYTANCFTCHGENGKGDGPGGAALEKKPADLGACIKQNNESDGSLFWKISEGRSPMVSWKGALSETQRWELVNYIKTLAGK